MGAKAKKVGFRVKKRVKEIVIVGGIFGTISSIFVFGQMIGTVKAEIKSNAIDIEKVDTKIDKVIVLLEKHNEEAIPLVAYFNCARPQLDKLVQIQGRPMCK